MKRFVMILVLALVMIVPVMAQDATEVPTEAVQAAPDLPLGCNVGILSQVFSSFSAALEDLSLTADQAAGLADAMEGLMSDTKVACSGGATTLPEGALDYSQIEQARLDDGGYVLGSPDAPITIVEFSDFLCPHCQEYEPVIEQFVRDYVATGQARLEYRMFPVIDAQLSVLTAVMVECADTINPGSFWDAHAAMFELLSLQRYNTLTPFRFAARAGLDFDALSECVAITSPQITVDAALGDSVGVTGTPAVRMRLGDGELVPVEYEGTVYDRGGVSYDILAAVTEAAQ
ncbi:MAG: thioredoxin domain-containing protein [Anaerolineaceae bacterium]|nr:thioredoxin domain-containing protein [Anaerolineaceae bacterium]